jgi:plastocyanin
MTPMGVGGGHAQRTISILDACDPDSFNAALGPGTCTRKGGVSFDNFIDLLRRHHSVGAWHFTPPQAAMDVGDMLIAVNQGGETHTFTEVEEFGGGIVPMLNELSGLTSVAPECNQLQPADFIPAGGSSRETEEEEGVEKYQCCIHPWMRAEVRIGKH